MTGLEQSLSYVINGHLFWQSMGMTCATAMFIGAILFHESNKTTFQKAILTLITYTLFVLFTTFARVLPNISNGEISTKTYASSLTIVFVTISYLLGIVIGYSLLRGRNGIHTKP